MYLLKLRRVEQTVASTYLWQRMVRDVEANAPWQRLRRNLLLLVQLLVALLLMMALARPFTWSDGPVGGTVVLILDHSMSMAAADVSPNRLEFAKAEINCWIDSLPGDTSVTLIAAGETPQVVVASTRDRRQLKMGLNKITISPEPNNLDAALMLAKAIANQNPDAGIQLFSDFAGPSQNLSSWNDELPVRAVVIGEQDTNQAISAVSLQADENQINGFIQVTNLSAQSAFRRIQISAGRLNPTDESEKGEFHLINVVDLEIPPHETESVVIDDIWLGDLGLGGRSPDRLVLHAQFTEPDLLPLDDQGWAIGEDQAAAQVLLVSEGNRFLQTALALLPGIEITTQRPADFEQKVSQRELIPQYALTIFDSYVPITATLPASNLFFIGPTRSTPFFEVVGSIEQPVLQKSAASDPLLDNLSVAEVSVLHAARISQPEWATALLIDQNSQSPLLFAGTAVASSDRPTGEHTKVDQRIAVLSFDIRNSDLPLQVAFPLLLANLIDWLGGNHLSLPVQVERGATVTFLPPAQVEEVRAILPNGSTERLFRESRTILFTQTEQPGLYTFVGYERGAENSLAYFAVNAFSPIESDITPGSTPTTPAASTMQVVTSGSGGATQQSPREWWRTVALVALIVLMVEWLIYHRGTVVRLWGSVSQSV